MNCSFYLYMLCHLTGFSISYSETDLCPVRCGVQFLQGVLQLRLSTAACAGCLVCLLEAGLSLYSLRPPLNCEFCQDGSGFLFPVSSALCMLISEDWLKAEPQPTVISPKGRHFLVQLLVVQCFSGAGHSARVLPSPAREYKIQISVITRIQLISISVNNSWPVCTLNC